MYDSAAKAQLHHALRTVQIGNEWANRLIICPQAIHIAPLTATSINGHTTQ